MYHFFETIRVEDGAIPLLPYHEERYRRTFLEFFRKKPDCNLREIIRIPSEFQQGICKCRVDYSAKVSDIHFSRYKRRTIQSIRLMQADGLDYSYKYSDRAKLNQLLSVSGADDVLLIRHGLITDTFICNVALFDGEQWFTPKNPLLRGTRRASLIDAGIITEREIHKAELKHFSELRAFNAMIAFNEAYQFPVDRLLTE